MKLEIQQSLDDSGLELHPRNYGNRQLTEMLVNYFAAVELRENSEEEGLNWK